MSLPLYSHDRSALCRVVGFGRKSSGDTSLAGTTAAGSCAVADNGTRNSNGKEMARRRMLRENVVMCAIIKSLPLKRV